MAINVGDTLQPYPSGRYPIIDASHSKGGYFSVPTTNALNAIPIERRNLGMVVHVYDINTEYRLISGITNSFWTVVNRQSYVHNFGTGISASKSVNHNLGYNPNIQISSASGNLIAGFTHTSLNTLTLSYIVPVDLPSATGYMS